MQGIYVEIDIRCAMEDLWAKTQNPELHERWDLRFTEISYLPRPDATQPQRFRYATRIGFGLAIAGEGETTGMQEVGGSRTSALRFWSNDARSLIREGSGYWRYTPIPHGVRFLTWYDYSPRFGAIGRLFNVAVFRPLMGWATAWSFDRLRLWLEKGIDPGMALRQSVVYGISRVGVAFIWIYHGLVPKLLVPNSDERAMLIASGASTQNLAAWLTAIGFAEIGFGLCMLVLWRNRFLFHVTVALMVIALAAVAVRSPQYLVGAFNPVTLNAAVIALSVIGLFSGIDIPSARRCKRTKEDGSS